MWGRIIAPISMTVRRGTTIPVNLSIVFAPKDIVFVQSPVGWAMKATTKTGVHPATSRLCGTRQNSPQ